MNSKVTKYDVVVSGGGIAGISCAYTCSSSNLKTLLVEKESFLGGDVTGGLVIPVMKTETKNLNTDFYRTLVDYAKKYNSQFTYSDNNEGWFNPIMLKIIFERMLKNVHCDILLESKISDVITDENIIKSAYVNTNTLSLPIVSNYYVDATGDASLAKLLKCEFWNDNNKRQPASIRFLVAGVNLDLFSNFLESIDNDKNVTTTNRVDGIIHLSTAFTWDKSKNWALLPYFTRAVADKVLQEEDLAYFQLFTVAGMHSTVALNCPRLRDYNPNDPYDYSNALIEAREAIYRLHNFLVCYIPGFKKSYISNIASKIGQRETSRVKCKYDYTIKDIISKKSFNNPALHSNYPIDIHSNQKDKSVLMHVQDYTLPIESLMSKNYKNLYIVGKILGCDFKSQAALRVQSSCMSMGEAVGKDIFKKTNY